MDEFIADLPDSPRCRIYFFFYIARLIKSCAPRLPLRRLSFGSIASRGLLIAVSPGTSAFGANWRFPPTEIDAAIMRT